MKLSKIAIKLIKGDNILMARLMTAFNRGQNTIELWIANENSKLISPLAVKIIMEETRLSEEQILEQPEMVV